MLLSKYILLCILKYTLNAALNKIEKIRNLTMIFYLQQVTMWKCLIIRSDKGLGMTILVILSENISQARLYFRGNKKNKKESSKKSNEYSDENLKITFMQGTYNR